MKLEIPIIEPLLINAINGEWVHPFIEIMTLDFDEESSGNLFGNIMRVEVEFKSGKHFRAIVLTDENGMDAMMSEDNERLQNYIEMMFVSLGEDVWNPSKVLPFIFTKYGETFNETYPLFNEEWRVTVSPDVSINHDEVDWWWDS